MRRRVVGHRQSGFVLVLVLGTVILLSALLFGFSRRTRASLTAADGFRDSEQAMNCARAGVHLAIAAIRDVNNFATNPRFDKFRDGQTAFDIAGGTCSLAIAEEGGRINVNAFKDKNGKIERKRIDQFLKLLDLLNHQEPQAERFGYGLAAAIIDWTDTDDEVTQLPFVQPQSLGAECSHYRASTQPYPCRNRPVDVVDDLLGVRSMTPRKLERLRDFLTTRGDGCININAAPKLVIESLAEAMDATLAQTIIRRRETKRFEDITELRDVPGMTDNVYNTIKDLITVDSAERYYRVQAQASVAERQCHVEAILRRNTEAGNVDIILYRES